jgi:hypothetical protein
MTLGAAHFDSRDSHLIAQSAFIYPAALATETDFLLPTCFSLRDRGSAAIDAELNGEVPRHPNVLLSATGPATILNLNIIILKYYS